MATPLVVKSPGLDSPPQHVPASPAASSVRSVPSERLLSSSTPTSPRSPTPIPKDQEDRFWATLFKIAAIAVAVFLALLALGIQPLPALVVTAATAGFLTLLPCSRDYLRAQPLHLPYQ